MLEEQEAVIWQGITAACNAVALVWPASWHPAVCSEASLTGTHACIYMSYNCRHTPHMLSGSLKKS